jgi:EAL domain-containing protein (putative c-di-GMP-specific phosphodiesterase class I)
MEEVKTGEAMRLRYLVDQKLRRAAFEKLLDDPNKDSKLFVNVSPFQMVSFLEQDENKFPYSIRLTRELGINPERIVIEITEDPIEINIDSLRPLIDIYKKEGFQIAIDDVGSKSSNLDRIGTFHPDIIKVDMQMLRKSIFDRNYEEILYTLSRLGQSLGISLLFEGIETLEEMNKAMSFGSRYLQGFLFSKASPQLAHKSVFSVLMNDLLNSFYQMKTKKIRKQLLWESKFETLLQEVKWDEEQILNGIISNYEEIFSIEKSIIRFFVTDRFGNQITPNYIRKLNSHCINIESDAQYKNWSWRPYFLNHLYESYKENAKWVVSEPYNDIKESLLMRTFSHSIINGKIIFVDVLCENLCVD